jgi:RAD51-like protein 2
MAQMLLDLATHFNLAVVLMNQVTTKISEGGGSQGLSPALGAAWAHQCTNRVMVIIQNFD